MFFYLSFFKYDPVILAHSGCVYTMILVRIGCHAVLKSVCPMLVELDSEGHALFRWTLKFPIPIQCGDDSHREASMGADVWAQKENVGQTP